MATNDSGETGLESKDTQSTKRSNRGKVCLHGLAKRKSKGVKLRVEFNNRGQPFGPVASEMQSYIGILARQEVKVTYKSWKQVPKEVKDGIWEYVNQSYEVDEKWRAGCLESANTKWRQWKSTLYKEHILPNKDNPTKLNDPPPHILQQDWSEFVISRMSDEFKKLSEVQRDRSLKNIFPHRLSQGGYAALGEKMKEELRGDDEVDRAIMWKKARVAKGQRQNINEDKELEKTFDWIDDFIRQKEEGLLKSQEWGQDLLTCALESSEHGGRVRGVGSYITPSMFFNQPRESRQGRRKDKTDELIEARKQLSDQSRMIQILNDRLTKLENRGGEQEEKGSCSIKQPIHRIEVENEKEENQYIHEDVMVVDKSDALKTMRYLHVLLRHSSISKT